MGEEFNIFKNLDELRKTNLLRQLKSLESAKALDLNGSHDVENDESEFDLLINNIVKKSPTEKRNISEVQTPEKKLKKNTKSRRSSTSTDGSISPLMPLLENLGEKINDMPVSRRTRRSLASCKSNESSKKLDKNKPPSSVNSGRSSGKSGGRGRGRGRGRTKTSPSSDSFHNNSVNLSESIQDIQSLSSTEVSLHSEESADVAISSLTMMQSFLQQGHRGRQRVMRGRRRYFAELAARSTQVDYVDLVSSPMPRVEGFIDLGSDTEEPCRITRGRKKKQEQFNINCSKRNTTSSTTSVLNTSFDEDNPEINIKVNWKSKLEVFQLRKHQKFSDIFKQLAERENIRVDSIFLNLNNRIITPEDTPDSIKYKIFHFIDGRILANNFNSEGAAEITGKKRDANQITLKIQSDKWKRPLQINIMKSDKFRILYIKCAEELKVGLEQIKLSFDGELLELNDTPTDLELEGGEAIDLHIKN